MPSTKDIPFDDHTSFLLIGDVGTHKTYFIGTCPKPAFIFDFDGNLPILAGQEGIDYETIRELDQGTKPEKWQTALGNWYEWGSGYLKFKEKLNEIGKSMDTGECKYRTVAIDSLSFFYPLLFSYTMKTRIARKGVAYKDDRQQFGDILEIVTQFFTQFTAWPVIKIVTAHQQRAENKVSGSIDKLPAIPGKFAGQIGALFNEVYYTELEADAKGNKKFIARTSKEGSLTQAKSAKFNLPDKTELDYNKIMEHVRKTRVHVA